MERGAIDQSNDEYSIPRYAIKSRQYKCPCCNEMLILKKGLKNRHHFAHFAQDDKCQFYDETKKNQYDYDRVNECNLHKQAKKILKRMLEDKTLIVNRHCATMQCNTHIEFIIKPNELNETIEIEKPTILADGRLIKPDVIKMKGNEIVEIYEIFDSHRTDEDNRINLNWYEFKATEIIDKYYDVSYNLFETVLLKCCRQTIKCTKCVIAEQNYLLEYKRSQKLAEENAAFLKKRADERAEFIRREEEECKIKKQELLKKLDYKIGKQPDNEFWKSLKTQLIRKGELSEKQIYHINKPIYISNNV
jgi:hypothetical protein